MGREQHRPVNVADAKARLRDLAGRDASRAAVGGALLGGEFVRAARRRPFTAVGIALAAGFAFGASRRVRSQVLSTLLRMLR